MAVFTNLDNSGDNKINLSKKGGKEFTYIDNG